MALKSFRDRNKVVVGLVSLGVLGDFPRALAEFGKGG